MFVDDMPRSFLKRNNSYSHCPLKKRPVHVMIGEETSASEPIKEEMVDVVVVDDDDVIPEPENLSTKPEDLSRRAAVKDEKKRTKSSISNSHSLSNDYFPATNTASLSTIVKIEDETTKTTIRTTAEVNTSLSVSRRSPSPASTSSNHSSSSRLLLRSLRPSPSPSPVPVASTTHMTNITSHSNVPHHHQNYHNHLNHHQHYPIKTLTPPGAGIAVSLHQMPKKAKVEVLQHENTTINSASSSPPALQHFMATTNASPTVVAPSAPLEPLNLNTPVEPLPRYATPAWARTAPLFPPHYLPYPAAYRYQPSEIYPAYPVAGAAGAGYSSHSPDHVSVSPPPHAALTCPTIQRPVARSYAPWGSPEHCGLSPTSSLGSGSLRSPPPVTPEDLSSPGSDSGRSSAGSTSAGPIGGQKIMEKNGNSASPRYQCPDCGKSYSTYSGLSKHQQFHCAAAEGQTKKSFSCKYCEKVYVSLGALKMHIRTHTLPCKCHLCGKAFSRPWLLQGHIRTHTGEKPFSCQHCNRAFADRSNLRAHLQTHSDVKKYSCSSCSKTFSRMSLLTKHQESGCSGVAVPIAYGC